jgi:transaldolase
LKDIGWAAQAGLIDGVTTNPSLLARQAADLDPQDDFVAALVGADVATLPAEVLRKLLRHPLTDRGLEQFPAGWRIVQPQAKAPA